MARLGHHLDHLVVGYQVRAVGERGVDVGVEGPCGSDGVALDAGNLHQSADGVARQSQVVFEPHFGGVFDLRGGSAEELAGGCGGHGGLHEEFYGERLFAGRVFKIGSFG